MTEILDLLPRMQSALDTLAHRHGMPGASLAVLDGDVVVELATGVTSRSTGVPVTPVIDEYPQVVAFLEADGAGRPGYLHFGGRAAPRVVTGS